MHLCVSSPPPLCPCASCAVVPYQVQPTSPNSQFNAFHMHTTGVLVTHISSTTKQFETQCILSIGAERSLTKTKQKKNWESVYFVNMFQLAVDPSCQLSEESSTGCKMLTKRTPSKSALTHVVCTTQQDSTFSLCAIPWPAH